MSADLASLANVLDAAVVVIHDMDGRVLYWTSGCERLYGYTRLEAVGQRVHDLLDTRYPTARAEVVATLAERGAWQGELGHRTKDGSTLSIASLWVIQKSVEGATVAVLQNNTDMTGLKRVAGGPHGERGALRTIFDTVPEAMIVWTSKD